MLRGGLVEVSGQAGHGAVLPVGQGHGQLRSASGGVGVDEREGLSREGVSRVDDGDPLGYPVKKRGIMPC